MLLEWKDNQKPTDELTLVLLRGNGAPRTLRLRIPELKALLIGLSSLFVLLILIATAVTGAYIYEKKHRYTSTTSAPSYSSTAPQQSAQSTAANGNDTSEAAGLREDIARLHSELENRKNLNGDVKETIALQMLSPKAALVPEPEAFIKIKNTEVRKDPTTKETLVSFELHNTDPNQKQIRGYIIVLAKGYDSIHTYPAGLFNPKENILLNFTKGETFAVSRFRQAQASFKDVQGRVNSFQILLFNTMGRVLASLQVEGK